MGMLTFSRIGRFDSLVVARVLCPSPGNVTSTGSRLGSIGGCVFVNVSKLFYIVRRNVR